MVCRAQVAQLGRPSCSISLMYMYLAASGFSPEAVQRVAEAAAAAGCAERESRSSLYRLLRRELDLTAEIPRPIGATLSGTRLPVFRPGQLSKLLCRTLSASYNGSLFSRVRIYCRHCTRGDCCSHIILAVYIHGRVRVSRTTRQRNNYPLKGLAVRCKHVGTTWPACQRSGLRSVARLLAAAGIRRTSALAGPIAISVLRARERAWVRTGGSRALGR